MDSINRWRDCEVETINCKIRLARVYVDTGKTKLARGVLEEV
jgi:hypothetical protein